jgi:hypothetical protein
MNSPETPSFFWGIFGGVGGAVVSSRSARALYFDNYNDLK